MSEQEQPQQKEYSYNQIEALITGYQTVEQIYMVSMMYEADPQFIGFSGVVELVKGDVVGKAKTEFGFDLTYSPATQEFMIPIRRPGQRSILTVTSSRATHCIVAALYVRAYGSYPTADQIASWALTTGQSIESGRVDELHKKLIVAKAEYEAKLAAEERVTTEKLVPGKDGTMVNSAMAGFQAIADETGKAIDILNEAQRRLIQKKEETASIQDPYVHGGVDVTTPALQLDVTENIGETGEVMVEIDPTATLVSTDYVPPEVINEEMAPLEPEFREALGNMEELYETDESVSADKSE